MATLIKKELVIKLNTLPAKYLLTDAGRNLAVRLAEKTSQSPNKENTQKRHIKITHSACKLDWTSSNSEAQKTCSKKPFIQNNDYQVTHDDSDIISLDDSVENNPKKFKTVEAKTDNSEIIINDSDSDSDSLPDVRDIFPSKKTFQVSTVLKTSSVYHNAKSASEAKMNCDSATEFEQQIKTDLSCNRFSNQTIDAAYRHKSSEVIMTLEPNDYEIILVLDTCETSHA